MNDLLRKLPPMDKILGDLELTAYTGAQIKDAARRVLAACRKNAVENGEEPPEYSALIQAVKGEIQRAMSMGQKAVINATGVVLHTNLGRCPLPETAALAAYEAARHYTNLEYDLETGKRGNRYGAVEALLCKLTGAEAALIANNNAAAVLLCLSTLAGEREAIVSRGELVEIGGGFRIPDIICLGNVRLREVGTTNKTRLSDYEKAIGPNTALILKVHTSNYRIIGFTESVDIRELSLLCEKKGVPLVADLGSGCLDRALCALLEEPNVLDAVRYADLALFSGDKLLGGPQAGIVLGKKTLISRLAQAPIMRALRPDKLTLAALEATLLNYSADRLNELPAVAMLKQSQPELEEKARLLCENIHGDAVCAIIKVKCPVGGGAAPCREMDSIAVAVRPNKISAGELDKRLRALPLPIVGRIWQGDYLLDVRTVGDNMEYIAQAVSNCCQ